MILHKGRDSSVGTATRYGLDVPGIESRWGARFSAPVQTGPGAQPVKRRTGCGAHPLLAPRLKKEQSYTTTPFLSLQGLFNGERHPTLPDVSTTGPVYVLGRKKISARYVVCPVLNTGLRTHSRKPHNPWREFSSSGGNKDVTAFCDVMPCSLVPMSRRFGNSSEQKMKAEDGGSVLIRSVCTFLPECTMSDTRIR